MGKIRERQPSHKQKIVKNEVRGWNNPPTNRFRNTQKNVGSKSKTLTLSRTIPHPRNRRSCTKPIRQILNYLPPKLLYTFPWCLLANLSNRTIPPQGKNLKYPNWTKKAYRCSPASSTAETHNPRGATLWKISPNNLEVKYI